MEEYRKGLHVPRQNCFTNRPAEYGYYTPLTAGALAHVTVEDKVILCAHGNTRMFGPYSASDLNLQLYFWGLRRAKLITFKACLLGVDTFLEAFRANCMRNTSRIEIGWIKGYRGTTSTDKKRGKVHEYVWKDGRGVHGDDRVKIVRGTIEAPIGGMSDRYESDRYPFEDIDD